MTALALELLNGSAVIVDGFFLTWGIWYLSRERLRVDPHLPFLTWVQNAPGHVAFIFSVLVHDGGVWTRSFVVWWWRRFGRPDFSAVEWTLLAIGAGLIVAGGLLKIRAVTRRNYGDVPWLATVYVLVIFLAGSMIGR